MNRRQDRNESEVGASDLAFLLGWKVKRVQKSEKITGRREGTKGCKETMGKGKTMWACRGVRGATTVESDDREQILKATRELLALVIYLNDIKKEDVASAIFTTTTDLVGAFPATAARQLGWLDVPLMCAHEIDVPGSLHRCIRVLIHWNTDKSQHAIQHVYLKEAQALRPDKTVVLSGVDMAELNRWIEEQLASWRG